MSLPGVCPHVLNSFGTPLVIEPSPGQFSSDAGLLPLRPFDEPIGRTRAFVDARDDPATRNGPSTPSGRWSAPAPTASAPATRTRTTTTEVGGRGQEAASTSPRAAARGLLLSPPDPC